MTTNGQTASGACGDYGGNLAARMLEFSPVALLAIDPAGRIIQANAKAEQLLGLPRAEITLRDHDSTDWRLTDHDGKTLPTEMLPFRRAMETRQSVSETRLAMRASGGETRLLLVGATPMLDESGQVACVIEALVDVSICAQAEKALQRSEERYHRLFDSVKDAILLSSITPDGPGKLVEVNREACERLGYTREELLEKSIFDIAPHLSLELFSKRVARSATEDGIIFQSVHVTKDGRGIPVELSTHVFELDGVPYSLSVARDVSERKRATEAIRTWEENFRNIFENAPIGIYQSNSHGLLRANPALAGMFGFDSPADMVAHISDPSRFYVRPVERAEIFRDAMETGGFISREMQCRRKDGSIFTVMMRTRAVPGRDGEDWLAEGFVEDISERKLAERQVLEALDYNRILLESSPIGIVTYLATGEAISVNPAAAQMVGGTREQMAAQNFRELESWRKSGLLAAAEDALATGETRQTEVFHVTSFGRGMWLSARLVPFCHHGEPHLLTLVVDITEEKLAETRLRESEEKFRELAENVDKVFWICDKDLTRMIYVSPAYEKIWGRTCRSLYEDPRSFAEAIHPDDRVRVVAALERHTKGDGYEEEYRVVRPDGAVRWVHDHGFVVRNAQGEFYRRAGLAEDITERKRVEEAVQRNEVELAAIYDNTPLMMCLADDQCQVERMNRAMGGLLYGEIPAAIAGAPGDLLGCVNSLDGKGGCGAGKDCRNCVLRRAMASTLQTGEPCRQLESTLVLTQDGNRREIQVSISTTLVRLGNQSKVLVALEDITQRKQLEAQFLQSQKMEAIGQLAGGVAHDFNNILAAMLMELGLLQESAHLTPGLKEGLKEVESEAIRAANLTRQLLLFSRRQVARIEPLNLNDLISNLLKMLRRLLGENIEVAFHPAEQPPWLAADAGMLEQVVMNLCTNARDAMPKGGQLGLRAELVDCDAECLNSHPDAKAGRYVRLTVTDNGCGIPPEALAHIFEPFYTTKEVGKGTGLGLATAFGIVKQHSGWIAVASTVGQGTEFRIHLPALAEPPAKAVAGDQREAVRGGTETILLVEDDPALRRVSGMGLRRLGYQIIEAANGEEALKTWSQHKQEIGLVLTDMVMPGSLTGLELAERLQAEKPDLKIILASGYSLELTAPNRAELPVAFLAKPFKAATLARMVRECLDET